MACLPWAIDLRGFYSPKKNVPGVVGCHPMVAWDLRALPHALRLLCFLLDWLRRLTLVVLDWEGRGGENPRGWLRAGTGVGLSVGGGGDTTASRWFGISPS